MSSFDPSSTYVCLSPSGTASTIEVTPDFWRNISTHEGLIEGRLVAAFPCKADWPHWEMHPHGEELLVLLSGKLTRYSTKGARSARSRSSKAAPAWYRAGCGIAPSCTSRASCWGSRTGEARSTGIAERSPDTPSDAREV